MNNVYADNSNMIFYSKQNIIRMIHVHNDI